MDPWVQYKTVFTFEQGHYEFTRIPSGLKNASITFQQLMDEFLRGIDEEIGQDYMDNGLHLLVFRKTEQEYVEHLCSVFNRIREFGL